MHKLYNGMQITFPKNFNNPEYIHKQILEEYDGTNVRVLSKRYDCTERWIREIINKNKSRNDGVNLFVYSPITAKK